MYYNETIYVDTFTTFLQKIEEFKGKGYSLTYANTDKRVVFDGKNTVECQANICVALEKVRPLTRLYARYERRRKANGKIHQV